MVPWMIVPFNGLAHSLFRRRAEEGFTIFQFNRDRLVRAFHQEPNIPKSVSLELREGSLEEEELSFVPVAGGTWDKAYLTSFMLEIGTRWLL
jgi:hypothetical protein